MAIGKDGVARRPYLGRRLRELRESYAERINPSRSGVVLKVVPSASTLIACMQREAEYTMSSAAYNEVENGFNVPRDAVGFLDAVALCLRLTEAEKLDLTRRLAYDLVWARLGERTNDVIAPDPSW